MKPGDVFRPYQQFKQYMLVPEAIAKCPGLSAGAKLTWSRMARYEGEKGICRPSLTALGRELGISKDQARRYVRELIAGGLIRAQRRYSDHGDPDTSEYVFLWHTIFSEAEGVVADVPPPTGKDASTVVADVPVGVVADVPPKESHTRESLKRKKHTAAKSAADPLSDSRFDQFWGVYPRKVGKAAARKVFGRKVTPENWEQVFGAIQAQAPAMLASEPRFRPHATTWLNQERWADEPDVPETAKSGDWLDRLPSAYGRYFGGQQ